MNVPRNLYWSFTIEFEPMMYAGAEFSPSMTTEWLTFDGIRNWQAIGGCRRSYPKEDQYESSFYLSEHHPARLLALTIEGKGSSQFEVLMALEVDFGGYAGGDQNPQMGVGATAVLDFEGVIVVPQNLFPKPADANEASEVVSKFLDLDNLQAPEFERGFRYLLRPSIGE